MLQIVTRSIDHPGLLLLDFGNLRRLFAEYVRRELLLELLVLFEQPGVIRLRHIEFRPELIHALHERRACRRRLGGLQGTREQRIGGRLLAVDQLEDVRLPSLERLGRNADDLPARERIGDIAFLAIREVVFPRSSDLEDFLRLQSVPLESTP
jgi:hypothetical protein